MYSGATVLGPAADWAEPGTQYIHRCQLIHPTCGTVPWIIGYLKELGVLRMPRTAKTTTLALVPRAHPRSAQQPFPLQESAWAPLQAS